MSTQVICILGFCTAIVVATVVIRRARNRRRGLVQLEHEAGQHWQLLQKQLLARHLIVTHLLDSLPASVGDQSGRADLKTLNEAAERSVRSLSVESADVSQYRRVAADQDHFISPLNALAATIASRPAVSENPCVVACLEGLREAGTRIQEAQSTFNASVNAYLDHLSSVTADGIPQTIRPLAVQEIDFGRLEICTGSARGPSSAPLDSETR